MTKDEFIAYVSERSPSLHAAYEMGLSQRVEFYMDVAYRFWELHQRSVLLMDHELIEQAACAMILELPGSGTPHSGTPGSWQHYLDLKRTEEAGWRGRYTTR